MGQERFRTITYAYLRGAAGVFLFYNVSNRKSFELVSALLPEICTRMPNSSALMLVGTNVDGGRAITHAEGSSLAQSINKPHEYHFTKFHRNQITRSTLHLNICMKWQRSLCHAAMQASSLRLGQQNCTHCASRTRRTFSRPCCCISIPYTNPNFPTTSCCTYFNFCAQRNMT